MSLLKKLIYQTRYRGMLETELMLQNYIKVRGKEMGLEQLKTLEKILSMEEPKLLSLLTASDIPDSIDPLHAKMILEIRATYVNNDGCQ